MRGVLIRIDSKYADGSDAALFLASVDDPRLCHMDGQRWHPAITRLPVLRYDFFGGDFNGQITAPSSQFQISPYVIDGFFLRIFSGARVRVWSGEIGEDWSEFQLRFDGVASGEPDVNGGIASFSASPDDRWLDVPLLETYAGTGGIEGPDDLEGATKPLVLGDVRFAGGKIIDATNLVYQVNGGAVDGVGAVYDRAVSLGTSTGDFPDYATLLAAEIPPSRWATCYALGLVRLGAPPDGRVSFNVGGDNQEGFVRKPGEVIGRICSIAGGSVVSANMAGLDAVHPYNLQIDLLEQVTARQLTQAIADSVCSVAGVSWTGQFFTQPLEISDSASLLLNADGGASDLDVVDVSALAISAPFWRLATEAEPTYVVYADGEIATGYNYRGAYSADRTYRADDLVTLSDSSSWIYINEVASSGNPPPDWPTTSNSHWSNLSPPVTAVDIAYSDGTPIDDLKPAQAGSTRSTSGPDFPDFLSDYTDGPAPIHIDELGRRYSQLSADAAELEVDGVNIFFDGEPFYFGWERIDPVAKIGGIGGLLIEDSEGNVPSDVDLLNLYRKAINAPNEWLIQFSVNGEIQTELPSTIPVKALIGASDVSANCNFSASIPPALTATIDSASSNSDRGDISISDIVTDGTIVVAATFEDGSVESADIAVKTVIGNAPSVVSNIVEDVTWENCASDSFAQVTDDSLILDADGSGNLRFRFFAAYDGVLTSLTVVARYRLVGSGDPWSDATSEVVSTAPSLEPEYGFYQPGFVNLDEVTVNVGSGSFEVALFAKLPGAGSATFRNDSSSFRVRQ